MPERGRNDHPHMFYRDAPAKASSTIRLSTAPRRLGCGLMLIR
ncbi:hypothetical protein LR69_00520 [Geobacillus sp. BCO2]|nr:hypothetical protein LR69_00520 [Geobacillus sp. BCO2]